MALNLSCELVELIGLEFLCIIEVAGDPYFVAAREVRAGKYVGSESGKRLEPWGWPLALVGNLAWGITSQPPLPHKLASSGLVLSGSTVKSNVSRLSSSVRVCGNLLMVGIAGAKRKSRPYSRHILEADRGKGADVH
jgi:hypothetical protein